MPKVDLRTVLLANKSSTKKPWCLCPRASEGSSRWGRVMYISLYGAHLSTMPSGDRAVNPATAGASGHSGLQRVHIPVSAWKRSGSGGLTTSEKVSYYTRGPSRETDSLCIFSGSMEASAKYLKMGPAATP